MFIEANIRNPNQKEYLKCIDGLEIKDLTNINIFVGLNGIGKTSLLNFLHSSVLDTDYKKFYSPGDIKSHLPLKAEAFNCNNDVYICIDEIENGLDINNLKLCAENIINICKEHNNFQFFIVTHSLEFIDLLDDASLKQKFKNIAIYNITMTKLKGIRAYQYSIDGIRHFIRYKTEFRN